MLVFGHRPSATVEQADFSDGITTGPLRVGWTNFEAVIQNEMRSDMCECSQVIAVA